MWSLFWLATAIGIVIAFINLVRQRYTLITIIIFILTIIVLIVQGVKYHTDSIGKEIYIGKRTATNEQSITWTGFGGTYDALFLQCDDLKSSTSDVSFVLIYGEGTYPTWQTSQYSTKGTTTVGMVGIIISEEPVKTKDITSFTARINNVNSSSAYKTVIGTGATYNTSSYSTLSFVFQGTYLGDKGPITGIRVQAFSFIPGKTSDFFASFSGACSLSGRSSLP
jgi:hypothetical protein